MFLSSLSALGRQHPLPSDASFSLADVHVMLDAHFAPSNVFIGWRLGTERQGMHEAACEW
jgi:hypothetical protein